MASTHVIVHSPQYSIHVYEYQSIQLAVSHSIIRTGLSQRPWSQDKKISTALFVVMLQGLYTHKSAHW